MQHRVKFATHSAAEQAAIAAPKLGLCKYALIAYRDYDPYDGRGWCIDLRPPTLRPRIRFTEPLASMRQVRLRGGAVH